MKQNNTAEEADPWHHVWDLASSYHSDVMRYGHRLMPLVGEQDFQDIVHDFWLEKGPYLVRHIKEEDTEKTLGFILNALRWYALDLTRIQRRRREILSHLTGLSIPTLEGVTSISSELALGLDEVFLSLDEEEKQFLQQILLGKSARELAEDMGLSLATVYRRRHALLTLLQQRFL